MPTPGVPRYYNRPQQNLPPDRGARDTDRLKHRSIPSSKAVPTAPEPFKGFNVLKEKNRLESTALIERGTHLSRQRQGLVAVPEPDVRDTGLGIVDIAKVTAGAGYRVLTEGWNPSMPFGTSLFGLKVKPPLPLPGLGGMQAPPFLGEWIPQIKTPAVIAQIKSRLRYIHDEGLDITENVIRLNWRDHMLTVIPAAIQGDRFNPPLLTSDDIMSRFVETLPEDARTILTPEDIKYATNVLEESLRALNIADVEPATAEQRREIIAQVTRERSVSIYGMLQFQSDDMVEALIDIAEAKLDEGTSNQDLRDILTASAFESPEIDLMIEEMNSSISMYTQSLIEETAKYAVLHSSIANMELDEFEALLERRAITGMTSRPLVALMLPVEYWRKELFSLAGGFNLLAERTPTVWSLLGRAEPGINVSMTTGGGRTNVGEIFERSRHDMGDWRALGYAFENSNIPAFTKFMHEVMLDPITYFGFGVYAKGLRMLPRGIGVPFARVEEGFVHAVDKGFLRIKSTLASAVVKTTDQIVRQDTRAMMGLIKAFVEQDSLVTSSMKRGFRQIALEDMKTSLRRAVTIARTHPNDASEITAVGRMLRTQAPVTETDLTDLGKLVNVELDLATGTQLLDVNKHLGYTITNGGRVSSIDETAEALMKILGRIDSPVLPTGPMGVTESTVKNEFNTIRDWIAARVAKTDEAAEALISKPETVKALISGLASHIDTLVKAETVSPIGRKGYQLGALGAPTSFLDPVSKLSFMNKFDGFNRGFARLYLLFAMYQPFNIMEGGLKTVYAGLSPFWRGDMVKQFRGGTVGLVLPPQLSIFETAVGITLDLGPVGETLAATKGRLIGMSRNSHARARQGSHAAWRKYYAVMNEWMIQKGARVGLQQQANYLHQAMRNWLSQNHPGVVDAISTIVDSEAHLLRSAGMSDQMIRQVSSEAESRLLTNADSMIMIHKDFTLDKISAADVQKILQKYTDIGPLGINHLVQLVDTDQLYPSLSRVMTQDLPELIYQEVMHSPDLARVQLTTFMDDLIANPPVNLEDLRLRAQTLQYLGSDISNVIGAQSRTTREYASDIVDLKLKSEIYDEMWDDILIPFIQESEQQIQRYIDQLRRLLDDPAMGLDEAQKTMFKELLDQNAIRAATLRNTWTNYNELIKVHIADRNVIQAQIRAEHGNTSIDNPLIQNWWANFNSERASFWDLSREVLYKADADILELGVTLQGEDIPRMIDASGRSLTVSDVSKLFKSVPADLTRAIYIPEMGIMTDKVAWVSRVYARAEKVARRGNSQPDDIGFSRAAIGDVYDNIIKEMTGSPAVASMVEPRLQQAKGLHNELINYGLRKNSILTPEMTDALEIYGRRVLQHVEDSPTASRVIERRVSVVDEIDERAIQINDDVVFTGADLKPATGKVIGKGSIDNDAFLTIMTAYGETVQLSAETVRLQAAAPVAEAAVQAAGEVTLPGLTREGDKVVIGDRGITVTRLSNVPGEATAFASDLLRARYASAGSPQVPGVIGENVSVEISVPGRGTWFVELKPISDQAIEARVLPFRDASGKLTSMDTILEREVTAFSTGEVRDFLRHVADMFPEARTVQGIRETLGRTEAKFQSVRLARFRTKPVPEVARAADPSAIKFDPYVHVSTEDMGTRSFGVEEGPYILHRGTISGKGQTQVGTPIDAGAFPFGEGVLHTTPDESLARSFGPDVASYYVNIPIGPGRNPSSRTLAIWNMDDPVSSYARQHPDNLRLVQEIAAETPGAPSKNPGHYQLKENIDPERSTIDIDSVFDSLGELYYAFGGTDLAGLNTTNSILRERGVKLLVASDPMNEVGILDDTILDKIQLAAPDVGPAAPRKRTVDELLEAGEYKLPKTAMEKEAGLDRPSATAEWIERRIKYQDSEASFLRRVEAKAKGHFDDTDELSFEEEEFIETLLPDNKSLSAPPEPEEVLVNLTPEVNAAHARVKDWKRPNSANADKELDKLEAQGIEVDDARESVGEYRDVDRGDYEGADADVDYKTDKANAWEKVIDAFENINAEEVSPPLAPGAAEAPAPIKAATFEDVREAVRKEMAEIETRRVGWERQLAEKTKLDLEARGAAMKRGIERIGLYDEAAPVQVVEEARVSYATRTGSQLDDMSDADLVQEAITIRKDHVSGLSMESTEFTGTYLSTEAANRYMTQVSTMRGARLHSAEVTIKAPKIFKRSGEYAGYKNDFLPEGVSLGEGTFDEEALETLQQAAMAANKPDPMVVAGRKATAQLKKEGYDSVYLPESDLNEGILVVFDKKNVRLGPGREITEELLESEKRLALSAIEESGRVAPVVEAPVEAAAVPKEIIYEGAPAVPEFSWLRERQKALDAANESFSLNFPDYTSETALNAVGRSIFPFWTYETHRLAWIPRTWLRTPGTLTTQGKFQDYTDQGYIHIPGTSWEINPLRGTIWMGGMRRLLLRDFPEFYDRYPGLSNAFDWASRFGFYPNAMISTAFAVGGAATGQHQLGEIIPPIPQSLLEGYIAAFPDSTSARFLLDQLFPSRFRDYLVQQAVGELGGPGVEINDKRYAGTPLDREDEEWWARGQRKTARFNFASVMTGMLRMRPEERKEFARQSKEVIEECTGIPVKVQERAAEVGMRISEWMSVRPECRDLVQELEGFTRWRGLSSHLRESEAGQALAIQRLFWNEIEDAADKTQEEREALDIQWLNGSISQARYEYERAELRSRIPQMVKDKREDARFQLDIDGERRPIPMTLDEKQAFADKMGFDPIFMNAEDELAAMYYQIELEDTIDPDTGLIVKNWDKFFAERRQVERGVIQERSQIFYDRLHKRDTKLERLRRQDYEIYIRPYQQSYDFVLATRTEKEQAIIKQARDESDIDRRLELLEEVDDAGNKIVAGFQAELSKFKVRQRELDPELDARLALWEEVTPRTDAGLDAWRVLRETYGFKPREFNER